MLRAACLFCGFLLVCSIISRGIYSAGLPQVSIDYGTQMKLGHRVEAQGAVVSNREIGVATEPDLLISSILVEPGQHVEPDMPLLQIDLSSLNKKIKSMEMEIKKKELQIQEIKENNASSAQEKQIGKQRANEDYNAAKEASDLNLENAQRNLNKNREEQNSFGTREDYIQSIQDADQEITSMEKTMAELEKEYQQLVDEEAEKSLIKGKKKELEEAKNSLKNYEERLEKEAGEQWDAKMNSLYQEEEEAKRAVQEALQEGNNSLNHAKRGIEDAEKKAPADNSLAVAELEYQEMQEQYERYQKLGDSEGMITSSYRGEIVKMNVAAGDLTGVNAILTMTDSTSGYRFQASITEKEKKYVELSDQASVKMGNGKIFDITIDAVEEEETGLFCISGVLEQDVSLGNMGTIIVEKQGDESWFCVPSQAVHGSDQEHYVLIMEKKQTILGEQLYAVKFPVTIKDQNDTHMAVDGALSSEQMIITESTKLVQGGDTVRLLEN